jgi:4-hydroxy-tetrahydrodipicolinate synthase
MTFINGTYTVLVTPFTDNNKVDFESIANWLIFQNKYENIVGLVLLGTTSETSTLSYSEKIEIIKFVHNYNIIQDKPKQIIAGVGGNNTMEVIEFANEIKLFVDGLMVTVPYYNKPPQRGIIAHFKIISDTFLNLPIMMYNVPSRAGINMDPETMIELINICPNIVGLKETNQDNINNFINLLKKSNRTLGIDFKLFSGDDANIITYCKLGASGVISVASNIIPKKITDIVSLCIENKYENVDLYLENICEFINYLFIESNPIPIKEIMYYAKIYNTNHMRLPLVQMDKSLSKELINLYELVK